MRQYCPYTGLAVFLILVSFFSETNAQTVDYPEGDLQKTTAKDLQPRGEGNRFNEFWTYHMFLEDSVQVYLSFTRANFGSFRSPVSGIRLSIINLHGKYYELAREYPMKHFSFSPEKNYRFQNHPEREIWFEGELPKEQRIRILTEKDEVEYDLDLKISKITPGVRWGDGEFQYDGETIGMIMHIPYAEIKGSIRVEENEKEVEGSVYMDQTYQTTITPKVFSAGFRYIRHTPDNWNIGYLLIPEFEKEIDEVIGFSIGNYADDNIRFWTPESLVVSEMTRFKDSEEIPQMMEVVYDSDHTDTIERINDHERISLLGDLGWLARRVVRGYLGGEVVDYRGTAEINGEPGFFNYFMIK